MAPGIGPDAGAFDTDPVDASRAAGTPPAADEPAGAYRSPLLALPGAVAGAGADAGVAWHYGDPMGEQRAGARRAALFDRSHRDVLTVAGPDRLTWLNTITSQELLGLGEGASTEALVLSPQGHVEHHMVLTELAGVVHLDVEPARGPALRAYLDMMKFWSDVEITDVSADLALLRLMGPAAASALDAVLGVDSAAAAPGVAQPLTGGGLARCIDDAWELLIPRATLADTASALIAAGATPAGSWAADALRIPTRRPRMGVDTDERTIPNEVSWLATAVHLSKGCYRGQETVARVHNLGRPPRTLVLLNLDGSNDTMPQTGDPVLNAQGRTVGRVGTVAQHHEDGPIALALVKRAAAQGAPLVAGSVDAIVDPADQEDPETARTPVSAIDRRTLPDLRRPTTRSAPRP